jgi:phage protein D
MARSFYITVKDKESGRDLTATWGQLCTEISIVDEKGTESDKLAIELDDKDGQLQFPEPGKVLVVTGGYVGESGYVGGEFEVDQVDLDGWPQKVVVNGTPVSAKSDTKERKTEAHKAKDTKTFGDLMRKVAKRNKWTPKIDAKLDKIPIKYEGQTEEFDTQFLVRMGKKYGAQVSVKRGNLVVTKPGSGKSASGQQMTPMVVSRGLNLVDYHVSLKKRVDHKKAEARTFDRNDVKKIDVDVGKGEVKYKLKQPFKDKDEAKRAAESKLSEISRAKMSATFTVEGDVTAAAERPVKATGIRDKVDGDWITTRASHKFSDTYETTVDCEVPGEEDDEDDKKDE